jgi:putative peptide zinc metalloprotease protein
MTAISLQTAAQPLPPLRQELRIEPGAALVNGAPSWTLFDPVRHMFFQLGRIEFNILSLWARGTMSEAKDRLLQSGLGEEEADATISRVVDFSLQNSLTVAPLGSPVEIFAKQRAAQRKSWWRWLVDHYLFIRIPLVKPAAFLERTLPRVAPLWTRTSLTLFAFLGALGLLLVSRQWDAFIGSFTYFFNVEGLLAYAVALSLVKVAHELGHAYTATRFGCRVPAMGVSLLIMMPVLYTDTTGAWRLTSRKKRLMIDCAGVTVELMIASLATIVWVFMPEGAIRSGAFLLASTSWVMSLAVNLNPFMRFDGYYVLSDLLGVPNLQARSFALGRWWMREKLFALGDPAPEAVPQPLRRTLIAYAHATWLYRLILFIGIAFLVYHLFFKLLGIVLFVVEMAVFVVRPIVSELAVWAARRRQILSTTRGRKWPWVLAGLALLAILPLDRHVSAPAVLSPIGALPIVAGDPARIERMLVANGATVMAGTPIAMLSAPELERDIAASRVRMIQLQSQIDRAASDKLDLANLTVLDGELSAERDKLWGLEARKGRLVLRAPIDGRISGIEPTMHSGRWLGGAEAVGYVVTPGRYDVQAYVGENDIWRLEQGARARFVPDDPVQPSRAAKLVELASSAADTLDQPILASTNGGPIAVNADANKKLKPRQALYRVALVAAQREEDRAAFIQTTPGRIVIRAHAESVASYVARSLLQVWRQEASVNG